MRLNDIVIPFLESNMTIKEFANEKDLTKARIGFILNEDLTKVVRALNIDRDTDCITIKNNRNEFLIYAYQYSILERNKLEQKLIDYIRLLNTDQLQKLTEVVSKHSKIYNLPDIKKALPFLIEP